MVTFVNAIMHKPMKIVIDQNIPGVDQSFARRGDVFKVDGRKISKAQVQDARVLIVRSVTAVNSDLLQGTDVRFVGTATIGTDHLDIAWLNECGIRWASAPGCNADAAAQYTLAMMLLAGQRLRFKLSNRALGIVGFGNVGSRVRRLLAAYGVGTIKVCDPPLADAGQSGLCEMKDIADCDVITFHVPLTRSGPYATLHLIGQSFLAQLQPGTLLVNTSRGKVAEGLSLGRWLASGSGCAALDVWPDEPRIDPDFLHAVTVATPHVAGYSLDGKLRGTEMVYRQFCDWLGNSGKGPDLLAGLGPERHLNNHGATVEDAILAACPVARDDAQLRQIAALKPEDQSVFFDKLRQDYPERRDFAGWQVPAEAPPEQAKTLKALGFH